MQKKIFYLVLLIVSILIFGFLFEKVFSSTKHKKVFFSDCRDTFTIPKQKNPQRIVAIAGHFDMLTADEQYFVDSKLMPLYPTEQKAIEKFASSLHCGDQLFLKLVSISPDFATGEAELKSQLLRMENIFKGKELYNLQKYPSICPGIYSFEVDSNKYYSIVKLNTETNVTNLPYQKITITFPLKNSIYLDDCINK